MRNLLAFIILLIWLALGSWYYTCKVKQLCYTTQTVQTVSPPIKVEEPKEEKVEILDPENLKKAYQSVFTAEDDLQFRKSQEEITYTDKLGNSLDEIADFLKKHPQTQLTITGYYTNNEENSSSFENLGIARAEKIKTLLKVKGEQLIASAEEKPDMFDENGLARGDEVIDFKYSEAYNELNETDVKSAFKALFKLQKNAVFYRNGKEINITPEMENPIRDIVFYLNRNKDQGLKISVDYERSEDSELKDQNIGLLRSYNFKQKLVRKDIDPGRLVISSKPKTKVFDETNRSLPASIQFNFIFPDKSDEDKLAEIMLERDLERALSQHTALNDQDKENLQAQARSESGTTENGAATSNGEQPNQLDIFFHFGSDQMKPSNDLPIYVQRLKEFLRKHPNMDVLITGHTCNIGHPDFNYQLGLKRADAAKKVLVKNGINELKLITDSKGLTMPAYENTTRMGRIKNRRVEIDIR